MGITHEAVKASGDRGLATEWNADHIVDDDSKPKNNTTLIVAASNSLDTTRADYVCDGVDDQDEINQAIADLPAQGGEISLLEGTFTLTGSVTLNKNNVTINGRGRGTKIVTTTNTTAINVTVTTGATIKNIWFEGTGVGNFTNYGVQLTMNTEYSSVKNCWFENFGGTALIMGAGTSHCIFDGNWIYDNFQDGIVVQGDYNTVVNNRCYRHVRHGIFMLSSVRNVLANNILVDNCVNDAANADGIFVDNNSNYNVIAGNICEDNDRFEINISDATCVKNLVHGNMCVGVDHVGAINDAGTNTTLADNVVA